METTMHFYIYMTFWKKQNQGQKTDDWLRVGESVTTKEQSRGISWESDGTVLHLDYADGYTTMHLSKLIQLYTKKKNKYNCT